MPPDPDDAPAGAIEDASITMPAISGRTIFSFGYATPCDGFTKRSFVAYGVS
jgi:hypothetical protein